MQGSYFVAQRYGCVRGHQTANNHQLEGAKIDS